MNTIFEIEKARQRVGVKPTRLSTMAGFSPQAYGKALRGDFNFTVESLALLAEALETVALKKKSQIERVRRIATEAA